MFIVPGVKKCEDTLPQFHRAAELIRKDLSLGAFLVNCAENTFLCRTMYVVISMCVRLNMCTRLWPQQSPFQNFVANTTGTKWTRGQRQRSSLEVNGTLPHERASCFLMTTRADLVLRYEATLASATSMRGR